MCALYLNCKCGVPCRAICNAGEFIYRCGSATPGVSCKIQGLRILSIDGYHHPKMPLANRGPNDKLKEVVLLEAAIDPTTKALAFIARLPLAFPTPSAAAVLAVLNDGQFQGTPTDAKKKAFLFPLQQRVPIIRALMPIAELGNIPEFFFKCFYALEEEYRVFHEDAAAKQCSAAHSPPLLDPSDYVYSKLKPFQRRGVEFIVEHNGRGMIADEMGLGKTIQGIAAAYYYREEWPLLILCPVSLTENWAREVSTWSGLPRGNIFILQGGGTRKKFTVGDLKREYQVVIAAYSSLGSLVLSDDDKQQGGAFNVIVMDESHYVKNSDSERTKLSVQLAERAKRLILLSGTPAMSRPKELFTQLSMLHKGCFPCCRDFQARYCNAHFSKWGGVDDSGHSNLTELNALLFHFLIRRQKKEVLTELPSKERNLMYLALTDKDKKALDGSMKQLKKNIGSSNGDLASAGRGLNVFELRQATADAKIPAVTNFIRDTLDSLMNEECSEKIIIFAHHTTMMHAIRDELAKYKCESTPLDFIYIDGGVTPNLRNDLADHFRVDLKCRVAVLSMQACGTGLNFTCASNVMFAELDWNPSTHLQCEDRVHRMGQQMTCSIQYLLAEGTSDTEIWPLLQEKMVVTTTMLNSMGTDHADDQGAAGLDGKKSDVKRSDVELNKPVAGPMDAFLTKKSSQSPTTSQAAKASKKKIECGDDDDVVEIVKKGSTTTTPSDVAVEVAIKAGGAALLSSTDDCPTRLMHRNSAAAVTKTLFQFGFQRPNPSESRPNTTTTVTAVIPGSSTVQASVAAAATSIAAPSPQITTISPLATLPEPILVKPSKLLPELDTPIPRSPLVVLQAPPSSSRSSTVSVPSVTVSTGGSSVDGLHPAVTSVVGVGGAKKTIIRLGPSASPTVRSGVSPSSPQQQQVVVGNVKKTMFQFGGLAARQGADEESSNHVAALGDEETVSVRKRHRDEDEVDSK